MISGDLISIYVDPNIKFSEEIQDESVDDTESNIVYLYNSDFVDGTYRIRESGTYIIMEDIVFNFGPPSEETMSHQIFTK